MIKAIVLDLDDTLLRYDKSISAFTRSVLETCATRGIKLIFATARGASAKELVAGINFKGCIMYNGAYAQVGPRTVYQRPIRPAVYTPFLQRLHGLNFKAAAQIGGSHFANFNVADYWPRKFHLTDFDGLTDPVEKLYVLLGSPGDRKVIEKWLPPSLYVHFTKDQMALLMDKGATKLLALKAVLDYLQIALEEAAAFGDDVNDMEMLAACGRGIAMENALPEVKAAADEICPSCQQDGVATWLAHRLLGRES